MITVVTLGGYGRFGGIISRRLAAQAGIAVVVAGRDGRKAESFARTIDAAHCRLDGTHPRLASRLTELNAGIVVNCAGPFQGSDYAVARGAIDAGSHYIDIADGRRFVCDIVTLDAPARQADVAVISGASSVPALSSAVIDAHLAHFLTLQKVETGISASEQVPGIATVAAVLSYAGREIAVVRNGQHASVRGWQDLRRLRFAAPAGRRWLCNCDVPDLELFPARYEGLKTVTFAAGLGLTVTHIGAWLLAGLQRAGLLPRPEQLARPLRRAAVLLERFGDGNSAMRVTLSGLAPDGEPVTWRWELIARNNDGANIPCLAAVALCRKMAAARPLPGARPCIGELSLEEYLGELGELAVSTRSTRL